MLSKIINLIYPPVCSICGKLNSNSLCNKCKNKLEKEYKFHETDYSKQKEKFFIKHYYFFKYKNLIRNQIISLKFQEKPYIYQTISKFLENNKKDFEKLKIYDIILVVPISSERKNKRGYNQSELIAKEISKICSIKIEKNIIKKIKNNNPQSSLNKIERAQNVKGVYNVVNVEKLNNKKILIFDDIYTTGNTVNECAKILVQNGIKRNNIGILTIAKD